ncbi:MAG: TonB-dependent siderophore receptor [Pseudomonadota bacterium]
MADTLAVSLLSAATLIAGSVAAQAQDFGGVDETIFVEGRRQAYQGLFDTNEVPGAIQDIDIGIIREVGAVNLNDVLDLSASVSRQNNFGGLWNSFAIRGFAGDENLPSGILVNGFNAGRGFSGPQDVSGIERVEVLKGPKAALFGRGEPGGAINIVTKRPTFERYGEMRFTYGRFDQFRLEGDYETPILDDSVAIRLVGFFEDAQSFRDTIETTRYGFSPSISWQAGEDTLLTYELEYTDQEIPFDRGVVAIDGQLGVVPIETFLGEPGDGPMDAEVLGHQLEVQHNFSSSWSLLAGVTFRETSLTGFSSEAELSGSRQLLRQDGMTLTRQRRFRDYDAEYFVIRAELAGEFETFGLRHRLIIGADYDRFETDFEQLRFRAPSLATEPSLEQLYAIDVFNPVYAQFPPPPLGPNTDRVEVQKAWGIYVQDQIDLSNKWQIRIGGRFDDFTQSVTNRLGADPEPRSDTRFSPQAGIVYLLNEAISLYATYGQGFRQVSDFAGNAFAPNKTQSAEIGAKANLFGNIGATLSAFWISQDNILVGDPETFGSVPAGEGESLGIELDVNAALPGNIYLWLSYAYTDAEFTNANPDVNFFRDITPGTPFINVPKNQLSVNVSKDTSFGEVPAAFGGGLLHVGERSGELATDFVLPRYTTVRAFVQVEPVEGLTLRLDLDNLLNKEFYTNSFADLWVEPGAPRRFRFSAAVTF